MTGLHAALAELADEWETRYGDESNAHEVFGPQKVSVPFAVEQLRTLLDEHPADLPVATDSATASTHVVHVTATPVAEDVVWCDECEEWVASGAPEHAPAPEPSERWVPRTGTVEDDLRSRLACVLEATYWDRGYDERIAAIRGMCDLTTNGMTPTSTDEEPA